MNLKHLASNWNAWGEQDAMYAVLTDPAKRRNGWDAEEFFATGRDEIAAVLAYLVASDLRPERGAALDFGCGVGRLSQAMAGHFDAVLGLDIAPSMIARAAAHNRFPDRCRYAVNAADDLGQVPSATIDFVYCNLVLQHMRPAYAAGYVREFFRVLRPGGVAVFFLPEAVVTADGAARPPRGRVRDAVRHLINSASYGLRGRVVFPDIDMFGTPREQVEAIVRSAGGTVVDVVRDPSAGAGWSGYRYCCKAG